MTMADGVRARLEGVDRQGPRYWPIASYGVIGDCRTAALVAPNGSIDWLCLPHFDSPATMLKLLDHDRGGAFQVRPVDACDALMRYLPSTNILETTYASASGELRVTDFMPVRKRRPHSHTIGALAAMLPTATHGERAALERELGNDVASAHRVNRIIACESGTVPVQISLRLTPDYARNDAHMATRSAATGELALQHDDATGYYTLTIRPLAHGLGVPPTLEMTSRADGTVDIGATLLDGQRLAATLSYARNRDEADTTLALLLRQDFDADLRETASYWTNWSASMSYNGPYHDLALRSALALKLCAFEPTGAIIAAPTTSLPEGIGGERNWDYRFSWLRDSSLTLDALAQLGFGGEARDYFHFLHDLHLKHGADIHVMYSIRGETADALRERELGHLEGYMGSRPVRVGNGAAGQRQMDIYGECADAALRYANAQGYLMEKATRQTPRDLRRLMSEIAEFVCGHWRDLDRGIWEERGPERAFVYSRVMCWVALDRAITLVSRYTPDGQVARWRATAEEIHKDALAHGYSASLGSFTQAYGLETADASNLRIPFTGFLPHDDPRIQGTVRVTGKLLAEKGPLLYRYLLDDPTSQSQGVEKTDDGLRGTEGAFLACAFWYVSCLCLIGEREEARKRLDALLEYASPLGLFSEELDPETGALLGNYPQAFTHLALLNALCWLHESETSSTI